MGSCCSHTSRWPRGLLTLRAFLFALPGAGSLLLEVLLEMDQGERTLFGIQGQSWQCLSAHPTC